MATGSSLSSQGEGCGSQQCAQSTKDMMKKTPAALGRRQAITVLVAFVAAANLVRASIAKVCPPPPPETIQRTDDNRPVTIERFVCNIENRMGNKDYEISFGGCDNGMWFDIGESTESLCYHSATGRVGKTVKEFGQPRILPASTSVTCRWVYAGNYMDGVEVWSEDWPEAGSCKEGAGGMCKIVFDEHKVVTLVTAAGRRVLGDVAVKVCSKNWGGFGGWLPFGLSCTYPKHEHHYVGRIVQ